MTKREEFIWKALNIACWVIFLGFCTQTGALLFNYIFSLFRPIASHNVYMGLNLSEIYGKSIFLYTCLLSFAIFLSACKSWLFYWVIKLFRKLDIVNPFSQEMFIYISKLGYFSLSIGIVGYIAHQFAQSLTHKGYEIDMIGTYWKDSGAYVLMSAIIFVIAMIFNKGIQLRKENELTI